MAINLPNSPIFPLPRIIALYSIVLKFVDVNYTLLQWLLMVMCCYTVVASGDDVSYVWSQCLSDSPCCYAAKHLLNLSTSSE